MKLSITAGVCLLLIISVHGRSTAAENAAASRQLLQLNQWDWEQAVKAPRQQHLRRSEALPATQQQPVRPQLDRQQRDRDQLYERQRREQLPTSRPTTTPLPQHSGGGQDSRRLQQQQMQRFKTQSDNLRLQQDIQRRAYGPK